MDALQIIFHLYMQVEGIYLLIFIIRFQKLESLEWIVNFFVHLIMGAM
jgi:hypothetical protein